MTVTNNKKGFTLIEIVIVLAIAALIIAGVLIAVGGAQKSRRDTQRKDDAGKITSYLEQSASNKNGAYPSSQAELDTFGSTYAANLKDPSLGSVYTLTAAAPACNSNGSTAGTMYYQVTGRKYTLTVCLEQGQQTAYTN